MVQGTASTPGTGSGQHILERDIRIGEATDVNRAGGSDQFLDVLVDVPDVHVHAGDHAIVGDPEGDEFAGVDVAAVDDAGAQRERHISRVLHAEVELVRVEVRDVVVRPGQPEHAASRGIILADTKLEFGVDEDGQLVLADEAFTPDSSRFWPADQYAPGGPQPSFDKQFVRDYCESLGWDKTPPGPELPDDVVAGTRARYIEAFERLTEIPFDRYLDDPEVVLA